jgi:hypothetical protein
MQALCVNAYFVGISIFVFANFFGSC